MTLRRSSRPWFALLLLTGCADYERPVRPCDRLGLLCVQEDAVHSLSLTRSKGATGDLDGDGVLDLVSAADGGLSIAWGQAGPREYWLFPGGVPGAGLGDVDGDGDLDVVFVTRAPANLRVLENRGKRSFVDGPTLALAGRAESLWFGRLDADDSLDAVVGGSDGLRVITGGLKQVATLVAGRELVAVEAGDLDGDGRLDIVAADRGDAAVRVALAQGDGFAAPRRISTGVAPEYLQLYDLDGDEQLDILTHGETRQIWLHQSTGAGDFAPARALAVQDGPSSGFGAHRDEQGRRWLLTIDGGRPIASQLDDADEVVRRGIGWAGASGLDIEAGAPLVQGSAYGARYAIDASHVFTEMWHGGSVSGQPLALVDLDQDGELDLVNVDKDVLIRLGRADGTWGEPWKLASPARIYALVVADATGDGVPDLVIGDTAPSIYVAIGAGDGTFTAGPPVPLAEPPYILYAGLAAAGEPAAVASAGAEPGVLVHRFDPTGALIDQTQPAIEGVVNTLAGSDLDADGREDLVVLTAGEGGGSLVIVPRVEDGWGPVRVRSLADLHPEDAPLSSLLHPQLTLGDVDLDGRVDAVMVAGGTVVRLPDIGADPPPAPQLAAVADLSPSSPLALADIDGDDFLDLVACSGGRLRIVLMTSTGALQPQTPVDLGALRCALHVDPTDGRATAAAASDRGLSVLRPDFAPALAPTALLAGGPRGFNSLAVGDIDADGHPDIAAGHYLDSSRTVIWGGVDGTPRRASWTQSPFDFGTQLAVAPLDDRPGDELLIAGSNRVEIFTHADGELRLASKSSETSHSSTRAVGTQRRGDEPGDVIVLGMTGMDELGLLALPRGEDGGFIEGAAVKLWSIPSFVDTATMEIADFDADGHDDIAVFPGHRITIPIGVFVVWGDRERAGVVTAVQPVIPELRHISSGDLDGDGAPELLLGSQFGTTATTFRGREPVELGQQLVGTNERLWVADLEGDGRADFLSALGSSLLLVLRSSGDDAVTQLDLAAPWTQLRAVDLDGDEILDLVALQDGHVVTRLSAGQ